MDVTRTETTRVTSLFPPSWRTRWLAPLALSAMAVGCSSLGNLGDSSTQKQDEMAQTLAESARIEAASSKRSRRSAQTPDELLQLGESELDAHSRTHDSTHLVLAKRHFQTALQQQPGHPKAHHRLAVIADLERDFATSSRHYHQALQATPTDAHLLHDIGYSYALQGKHQDAIPYFQRSIQVDPTFELAVRKLADAYVRVGQTDAAQQTLAQIMPQPQAMQEVAQLKRLSESKNQPSLLGKVKNRLHDLRPEQQKELEPTQQLMAEIELARAENERLRAERGQQGRGPGQPGQPHDPRLQGHGMKVPDAHLAHAMSQIDRAGLPTMEPHYIGGPPGGMPNGGMPNGAAAVNPAMAQMSPMAQAPHASPWENAHASHVPQGYDHRGSAQQGYSHSQSGYGLQGQGMEGPLAGHPGLNPANGSTGSMNHLHDAQMLVASNQPQSLEPSYPPNSFGTHNPGIAAQHATTGDPQPAERAGTQPWPGRNWRERAMNRDSSLAHSATVGQPAIQPAGAMLPTSDNSPNGQFGHHGNVDHGTPHGFVAQADHSADVGAPPRNLHPQQQPVPQSLQREFTNPVFSEPQPASPPTLTTPRHPASNLQQFQQPQVTIPARSPSDDLRAAAAAGLGAGPGQMLPVIQQTQRLSPGANSTWNGLQFPQPARSLPTDRPHADLNAASQVPGTQQGLDALRAGPNSLGQQMPSTGQYYTRPDHYGTSGWGTQPNFQSQAAIPPVQPATATIDQHRTNYDQQYNQTIQHGFTQAPANAIASPSAGLPMQRPLPQQAPAGTHVHPHMQTPEQYPSSPAARPRSEYGQPSINPGPVTSAPLPPPSYPANVVVPARYQPNSGQQPPPQYDAAAQYHAGQYSADQYNAGQYNGPVISPRR